MIFTVHVKTRHNSSSKFSYQQLLIFRMQFKVIRVAIALLMSMSSIMAYNSNVGVKKVIDSHLHIWDSASQPFASDDQTPPDNLKDCASAEKILRRMEESNVDGCMIVQPINYKFNHDYVGDIIAAYPDKFKGMLLFDPSVSDIDKAIAQLEQLLIRGFVGVRFNPYLFSGRMSEENGSGLAVYKKCAELNMPVGVMCFKGLGLHYDDIVHLINASPDTILVLDHFGFTRLFNDEDSELIQSDFDKLLSLAKYPNVYVKISAIFRIANLTKQDGSNPYDELRKERFDPLVNAFGYDRLMMGTDFPFVELEELGYKGAVDTVSSWCKDDNSKAWVLGWTAEKVFGPWGTSN